MNSLASASAAAPPRRLVLASNNRGKLAELRSLLAPMDVRVQAQGELGIDGADEPYGTFIENALAKARHVAQAAGAPALADDSGLCCSGLGGAPGVRSARFAGAGADDAANNALLVARLRGVGDRRAHYVCVVVALRAADDPEPLVADGRWDGEIVDLARGAGGFGYDPHFRLPGAGLTAAELDADLKNRLSHRGQAMRAMALLLRARWGW
jgi:XTP/dITP diphosphohydrolase